MMSNTCGSSRAWQLTCAPMPTKKNCDHDVADGFDQFLQPVLCRASPTLKSTSSSISPAMNAPISGASPAKVGQLGESQRRHRANPVQTLECLLSEMI